MAIVVEDGTGRADAETYAAVAELDAHCAAHGLSLTGRTEPQKEAALRKAAAFVDTLGRYKGRRLLAAQALEFPREGLVDWGGHPVPGVPTRVKRACLDLAFKALSGELLADLDRGGRIASETVGPISVSYAPDAPAGRTYQQAEKLLAPYLREATPTMRGPGLVEPEGSLFALGLHDAPGTPLYEEE